jgi:hypothetical protein
MPKQSHKIKLSLRAKNGKPWLKSLWLPLDYVKFYNKMYQKLNNLSLLKPILLQRYK